MFDVCTMGDTAYIDTIFKFLPHVRHLQRLMDDHLISACTETKFQ